MSTVADMKQPRYVKTKFSAGCHCLGDSRWGQQLLFASLLALARWTALHRWPAETRNAASIAEHCSRADCRREDAPVRASIRRRAGAGVVPPGCLGRCGFRPGRSNLAETLQTVGFHRHKSGAAQVTVNGDCTSSETCAKPTRGEQRGSES